MARRSPMCGPINTYTYFYWAYSASMLYIGLSWLIWAASLTGSSFYFAFLEWGRLSKRGRNGGKQEEERAGGNGIISTHKPTRQFT
jgi:hypothetical protein